MTVPREGMMAEVRNRRAIVTGVRAFSGDQEGTFHLVDVDYADGIGSESEQLLWEVEPDAQVLEPTTLPTVSSRPPMRPDEFDALTRASRWNALTPSLPFSGLSEDRPPLASPLFGAIQPEAYQLVPVLRALEAPRVALLLGDAVGLGKTVQAGMIVRELMLRRRVRRVLVLSPASLRTQWREEMAEKFSLPFAVVDRPEVFRLQREFGADANPWRIHERVIASYHWLKQPDVLEQFRAAAEPGPDGRLKWDVLVVDEAHNLAPGPFGEDSDLAKMLQAVAPWFEHRIFLTATPHNGHTRSFSGLLEVLDPVRFTRKGVLDPADRERVGEVVIRRLKSEINAAHVAAGEAPRFSERRVEALPVLRFGAVERSLVSDFVRFRDALKKAAARGSSSDRAAAAFASEVLQKRLLSGPWAFGQSWLNLVDGLGGDTSEVDDATVRSRVNAVLDDETDDDPTRETVQRQADRAVGAWLKQHQPKLGESIDAVTARVREAGVERVSPGLDRSSHEDRVHKLSTAVKADARWLALERFIEERLRSGDQWRDDERLVVFTEYLATLDYVVGRLRKKFGDGDWLISLYGGLDDQERDGVKRAFNDADSRARILVATDAAGEGLNLQRAARLLLHWDIPWNPGRMEQRNGRLDRHGQARDVEILHFDSTDDASMRFLGKVLRKRSQTREDKVITDTIFSDALLAHFEHDEAPDAIDARLDQRIEAARAAAAGQLSDIPEATPLPGADDQRRLDELRRALDLSPDTLRETLETCLALKTGKPRLDAERERPGRHRFTAPIPGDWKELVKESLGDATLGGAIPALVFDPAKFIRELSGRPVFLPDPDARLVHLGHALSHRVLSTFARMRFEGREQAATRWITRSGGVPKGADALLLLTVEEFAVNELREVCHQWVRTLAYPVRDGKLGELLATAIPAPSGPAKLEMAREVWDDIEKPLKQLLATLRTTLTTDVKHRLEASGKAVQKSEKARFEQRRREIEKEQGDNRIDRLTREIETMRAEQRQLSMLPGENEALARAIADLEQERKLREGHYEQVLKRLEAERIRTLERVIPPRYRLRGDAQLFPVSVEIRLPGGVS